MSANTEPVGGELLELFAASPGLAVGLLRLDGTIVYANETGVRMFGGGSREQHLGANLRDLYPPEWVDEKLTFLRRAAETGEPLVVRMIWEGKRLEAQYQPLNQDGETRILVTVREGVTEDDLLPDDVKVVESGLANFGPLSVLSPRELEVLALIGQGKSAKAIGEILELSPRTVERHRDSIGKKLRQKDRVSLALIARAAGLELRDAHLKPVGPVRPETKGGVGGSKPASETEPKPGGSRATPAG